ncbi:hypothetical protein [Marinicauda salina]|uniref:hypothetical protein n=1 Tax=Marinicauda salina TaxID=2135793 RepID=UPI001304A5C2|nr:hypothetical protein [Marinicauda salina]
MTRFLQRPKAVLRLARLAWRDPDVRYPLIAAAGAFAVHVAALYALLAIPVHDAPDVASGPAAVDVRLYTVAGEDAVTDAPLNEPGRGETDDAAETDGDAAPEPEPAPEPAPEPEPDTQPEPARADARILTAPGGTGEPAPAEARLPDVPAAPRDPDEAIETTPARAAAAPATEAPPSLADIAARAAARRLEEFAVARGTEGAEESVNEGFCLSSSEANLEAGECGDEPNPMSARLAQFGLSQPGEEAPEFLVDMSRLAFELEELGADPSAIQRILAGLRNDRREAIDAPELLRRMERAERSGGLDNLGLGESVTPDSARGPSEGGG